MKQKKLMPARVVAQSFALIIAVGTILLTLPFATTDGQGLSLVNAFFTATSSTCVTGLTVVNTARDLTFFGQIVVISLIQTGGVGLMTLATLLFVKLGVRLSFSHRTALKESLNHDDYSDTLKLTRKVLRYTFVIESTGALFLALRFIPEYGFLKGLWFGVFHAISAFNNAGFDVLGNSLEGVKGDWYINGIIMMLIVLGGLGFVVISELVYLRRKKYERFHWPRLGIQSKVVLMITGILIFGGAGAILLIEYHNPATMGLLPVDEKILTALLQSVTCRTAGFNSLPLAEMHPSSSLVMIFLMFIGASPGSTGGGIKTTTFGIIMLAVYAIIRGREDLVVFGRHIPVVLILKALAVTVLSAVAVVVGIIALSLWEDVGLLALTFEAVSAFSTTGVSMGITANLSSVGKLLLTSLMFIGRTGPLTLAVALTSRSKESKLQYPEGHIMIG